MSKDPTLRAYLIRRCRENLAEGQARFRARQELMQTRDPDPEPQATVAELSDELMEWARQAVQSGR